MSKNNAERLAEYVGECWGNNSSEFLNCFAQDAQIHHPFFSEPITPKTAMEIMSSKAKVNTVFHNCVLLEGRGDGESDSVRMEFLESGNRKEGVLPKYIGKMIVEAEIEKQKFKEFRVIGYDVLENEKGDTGEIAAVKTEFVTAVQLAKDFSESWTRNEMEKLIGLFSKDAVIYHPVINRPASPREVADIIALGTEGVSLPREPKLVSGDGSGTDDILDLYFEETGGQLGYIPEQMALKHVTVRVKNGQITEMIVHGYTPVKNTIDTEVLQKII